MKILIVIPNYFKAENNPTHGYNNERKKTQRINVVKACISAWRSQLYSRIAELNIRDKKFELHNTDIEVDIRVITANGCSLLERDFFEAAGASLIDLPLDDPRMLGFEAHRIMASEKNSYDVYIYAEDDLLIEDKFLLHKILNFQRSFGNERILLPNRYEYNLNGPAPYTFIDGQVSSPTVSRLHSYVDDRERLESMVFDLRIDYERARNPHSGFFAITSEQLNIWMDSNTFLDRDCSFVSPLESAAGLSLSKTFALYKSCRSSLPYCSIRHLQNAYSNLRIPRADCD